MIDATKFQPTPGFGLYEYSLGTLEVTKVQCRVNKVIHLNSVDLNENPYILFLTNLQMQNLRQAYGSVTIKNPITKQKITVNVMKAGGSVWIKKGVDISAEIAKTLGLKNKSPVKIKRTLDERGKLLFSCSDTPITFGKCKHIYPGSYATFGRIVGIRNDHVNGRLEIHLTFFQTAYLRINRHLTPLCGQNKFTDLKQKYPSISGVVRLKYQDKIVEADVYETEEVVCSGILHGCAVKISRSLCDFFEQPPYCAELLICSRFDIKSFEEALHHSSDCVLNSTWHKQFAFICNNLNIKSIINTSIEELRSSFQKNQESDPYFSSNFLSYLSQHAELIPQLPHAYMNISEICHTLNYSTEYIMYLDQLKKNKILFMRHWETYMKFISTSLEIPKFPGMLYDFLYMGFSNIQDWIGETILHKYFQHSLNMTRMLIDICKDDFNIQNHKGETPLHSLCKQDANEASDYASLSSYSKKMNPLIVDNKGKTPLHHACINQNICLVRTFLFVYPSHAVNCLNTKDNEQKTPFDYLTDVAYDLIKLLKENPYFLKPKYQQAADKIRDVIITELEKRIQALEKMFIL